MSGVINDKIGFWPVIGIVIGCQVGSGVFLLPSTMAIFGIYSIVGWLLAGVGAMSLAIVFSYLCTLYPKTGGPHVYVEQTFGRKLAFFTGWTYWVVSWFSTTTVVVAAIGYLSPFIGDQDSTTYLFLEILLLGIMTVLNLRGVQTAGRTELILSIIKFIPLFIVPIVAAAYFDFAKLVPDPSFASESVTTMLGKVTLLALWGFIGVESATAPAGAVENPTKTIPKAILIGTGIVSLLYLLNSGAILGLLDKQILIASKAPYVDVTQVLFGGKWHLLVAAIAALTCIGTLNAWILTSGQIALGGAMDGLMPSLFKHKNKFNSPHVAILISSLCIVPFLVLTNTTNFTQQLTEMINISVTCFLYVYFICCAAFLYEIIYVRKKFREKKLLSITGVIAILFCSWVIWETPGHEILISMIFIISGLPVYLLSTENIYNK
jgi:APA family basic amino acid/polyamine antiporter